ncbi:hypothetical protein EDD21DRAFT_415773 [Dissophora ornata]|nr:hypothetical protein EDD21DRAFT_415773 [Dissophora ornata]
MAQLRCVAGLLLANSLEKANILYGIYERSNGVSPPGSIICSSPNTLPAFEQLGIYDELMKAHIYDDLDKHGKLPQSDLRKMLKGHVCLVGTTDPLDLAKYLGIDEPYSDSTLVIGVPGNKIFWILIVQLDIGASEDEQLRNSGWSSTANDAMIEDVYHFKTPKGKLGELIDETSKKHISEVFLEEILYET